MTYVRSDQDLDAIYGQPVPASLTKVADHLTPEYQKCVARSRFCILTTVGPDGTDATPRGDNRIDSLRNLVHDHRLSLMFMISGSNTVIRINGTGQITSALDVLDGFARRDKCCVDPLKPPPEGDVEICRRPVNRRQKAPRPSVCPFRRAGAFADVAYPIDYVRILLG